MPLDIRPNNLKREMEKKDQGEENRRLKRRWSRGRRSRKRGKERSHEGTGTRQGERSG